MIGYFRRKHFTPVPEVDSLAELNEMVDQWDVHDGRRRIGSRPRIIETGTDSYRLATTRARAEDPVRAG